MTKIRLFLALATALVAGSAFAQPDSGAFGKQPPAKILIAKTDTYLENTVATLISDSLSSPDCIVTTIPLSKLVEQNRQDFTIIILFNAVKRDKINPAIDKYIKTTENPGTPSNLLICTVYGEKWMGKETATDAVTSATKTLNPELVASRVIANIRFILQGKQ
jgi:hypothetical protein